MSLAGLVAYTACGNYPQDWKGWVAKPRTSGAYAFTIWCLSTTSQMSREGLQNLILGDIAGNQAGTGLIPRGNIVSVQPGRGIAGSVDFCTVRRTDGTLSAIYFKSAEQGRGALQAVPVSLVAVGELIDDMSIWTELCARTTTTEGRIRIAATARQQGNPIARWFKENASREAVTMSSSLAEASHLTEAQIEAIKATYTSEQELNCRFWGLEWQGGGSVFSTPWQSVALAIDQTSFGPHFKFLIGVDFSHFGKSETASHFAAVFLAVDPLTRVTYLYDAIKIKGSSADHYAALIARYADGLPIAYGHDGGIGLPDGQSLAASYKALGLNMRPTHATQPTGGYNQASGIAMIEDMLVQGKLRVASHLKEWFQEYTAYEYEEGTGKIPGRFDDLMSATRIGIMDLRFAKSLDDCATRFRRRMDRQQFVSGRDFDIFTGA